MADQEKVPTTVPIVEHLPNSEQPHPSIDGLPEGSAGHPGEHLEHEPIVYGGQVIATPPGYGVEVRTQPSEEEVERLLKKEVGEGGRWFGEITKLLTKKKAA
ncbi:hypothetical protein HYV21_00315 [Candidatus Microgenomates bacterium]|nr:hypothetical protein [Candidatus Microgenomates bacterium]